MSQDCTRFPRLSHALTAPALISPIWSVAKDSVCKLFKAVSCAPAGRDKVELLMCLGANRWEATRSLRQRCLTAALTQQFNQMGTMGLVTIPGGDVCEVLCWVGRGCFRQDGCLCCSVLRSLSGSALHRQKRPALCKYMCAPAVSAVLHGDTALRRLMTSLAA